MLDGLDKYAKSNGYAVVLDVSSPQPPVLYASTNTNLTKELVDAYNAESGVAPAAKPAASIPAPRPSAGTAAPPPAGAAPPPQKTQNPGSEAPRKKKKKRTKKKKKLKKKKISPPQKSEKRPPTRAPC